MEKIISNIINILINNVLIKNISDKKILLKKKRYKRLILDDDDFYDFLYDNKLVNDINRI